MKIMILLNDNMYNDKNRDLPYLMAHTLNLITEQLH